MLNSKMRVKKYKYHCLFFVTIQDSVDELGSGRRSGGRSVVPGDKLCAPQQEVPVPLVTHAV